MQWIILTWFGSDGNRWRAEENTLYLNGGWEMVDPKLFFYFVKIICLPILTNLERIEMNNFVYCLLHGLGMSRRECAARPHKLYQALYNTRPQVEL